MKDTVQRVAAATSVITVKLSAGGILALFLGAMMFMTNHVNANGHLCTRALARCVVQTTISDSQCTAIANTQVCIPEANGDRRSAQDGYRYLKRRT